MQIVNSGNNMYSQNSQMRSAISAHSPLGRITHLEKRAFLIARSHVCRAAGQMDQDLGGPAICHLHMSRSDTKRSSREALESAATGLLQISGNCPCGPSIEPSDIGHTNEKIENGKKMK